MTPTEKHLRGLLAIVLEHAEEMLRDELDTDDLSDFPWVQNARAALSE